MPIVIAKNAYSDLRIERQFVKKWFNRCLTGLDLKKEKTKNRLTNRSARHGKFQLNLTSLYTTIDYIKAASVMGI